MTDEVKERIEVWAGGYIRRNPDAFLTATGISTISALIVGAESEYERVQDQLQKQSALLDEMAEALRAYKNDFDGDAYNVLRETQSTKLLAKYSQLKSEKE